MKLVRRSKRDGVSRLMIQEGVSSKGMYYGELAMVRELDTACPVIEITLQLHHTRLLAEIVPRRLTQSLTVPAMPAPTKAPAVRRDATRPISAVLGLNLSLNE